MATFVGIGCMSGSSLDGLDICCVEFTGDICSDLWGYRILTADTIPYSAEWTRRLQDAPNIPGAELVKLHVDYGRYVGGAVTTFINTHSLHGVQFVASHGHSVFHRPTDGVSFQLGDGEATSTFLRVPFVCGFRTKDVCLGGEGAPLVPCGERYLFRNCDVCINLGGIANIGVKGNSGYDISPCNIILNRLATQHHCEILYDKDGDIARRGQIIPNVFEQLHELSYYKETAPKSLWRDYIESNVFPILDIRKFRTEDLLRTCTEHVATMVAEACVTARSSIETSDTTSVLITGGGALNKFLLERIEEKLTGQPFSIEPVDELTINFKEALIFAFLGLRCLLGEENVFRETTGARTDTISGSIHRPMSAGKAKQTSLLH